MITLKEYQEFLADCIGHENKRRNPWIPVTVMMPEESQEVLVTFRDEVAIAWRNREIWYSNDIPHWMVHEIVAWMPLPEPWKGDADD